MASYPDLVGKVAIVTGAAQNTGLAIATAFVEQGMNVVMTDIQEEQGAVVTAALIGLRGKALFQRVDVRNADEIAAMVQRAVAAFGRLDVVVNNARSRAQHSAEVTDLEPHDWDRTCAVLLRSHYLAAKYAIPAMIAGSGGSIIGISSIQGIRVSLGYPAYCAAKAAVDHLMRQIAYEYGPRRIRANAIAPGESGMILRWNTCAAGPRRQPSRGRYTRSDAS